VWLVAFLSDDDFRVLERVKRVREHEAFLPVYRLQDGREKPLYPGYLFLRYHHRWPSALGIQGIARVLGWYEGEQFWPHMVADAFIDTLRSPIEQSDRREISFKKGDWIRIVAGAENPKLFAHSGCFGQYHEDKTLNPPKTKRGHIAVELDYFHRKQILYFPPHCLELAKPPATAPRRMAAHF
jgi:hypothetical protein